MADGSRLASLEEDDILKVIDDKDEVYKSGNTIQYQFMKYCTKEKKTALKNLYIMEWSYHPLIEDKCQYPYK